MYILDKQRETTQAPRQRERYSCFLSSSASVHTTSIRSPLVRHLFDFHCYTFEFDFRLLYLKLDLDQPSLIVFVADIAITQPLDL